jgi:hypothetical protein
MRNRLNLVNHILAILIAMMDTRRQSQPSRIMLTPKIRNENLNFTTIKGLHFTMTLSKGLISFQKRQATLPEIARPFVLKGYSLSPLESGRNQL